MPRRRPLDPARVGWPPLPENETAVLRTPPITDYGGWWDLSDYSTITIATGISALADKSGNGRTLSQGTAGAQPSYGARFINGVVVADFDGSNDQWTSSYAYTGGSNFSFCCVGEVDSASTFYAILAGTAGASRQIPINANGQVQLMIEASTAVALTSPPVMLNVPFAFVVTYQNLATDQETFYLASRGHPSAAAQTRAANLSLAGSNLKIGARSNNTNFFNGAIAELIHYDRALTGDEAAQTLDYLRTKWGLLPT